MASPLGKLPSLPVPVPKPDEISRARIEELSHAYTTVALRLPSNAKTNSTKDEYRFHQLPSAVAKRRGQPCPANSEWTSGWLEKEEIQKLMDWKLHRGTWRPSLPGLIKSNDAEKVIHDTAEAFDLLEFCRNTNPANASFPKPALKAGARLKGVGPATASLILATAAPDIVPFMADELYAWFFGRKPEKYNDKELEALWHRVQALREQLGGVAAQDVEKAVAVMAWARDGKIEGWVKDEDGKGIGEDSVHEERRPKTDESVKKDEAKAEKVKKGGEKKRKAESGTKNGEKTRTQGTRKSERTVKRRRGD